MSGALALLLDDALRREGRVYDEGGMTSFAALRARADQVADDLASRGLLPDEPVHVGIGNRATDIAAMLGIWRAGGVAVPVHVGSLPATLARVAGLTGARFLVEQAGTAALADLPPPPRPLLHGAALVIFTSGSTGVPKGVVVSHRGLAGKLDVLDAVLGFTPADTVVVPLQMIFIFGIWASLLALRAGATLALVSRFSVAAVAQALAGGPAVLAAVPSMLRVLVAATACPAPRLVLTGGEPLGPNLRVALAQSWPAADVFDLYGLTETGSCDFCLPQAQLDDGTGSIGAPSDQVAFRIADPDGVVAPVGEPGELQIRTPFGMLGYLDNPAQTAAAFCDGYFRTGDIGRLRGDGHVELVGRIKEIVSRGGNKIAPQEIDNLLCSHPSVAAALCAGVPDARLGEALHAVVVLRDGAVLTVQDLRDWAAGRIERFKVPDVITIEDALPAGSTGKASRALLRERATTRNAKENR